MCDICERHRMPEPESRWEFVFWAVVIAAACVAMYLMFIAIPNR